MELNILNEEEMELGKYPLVKKFTNNLVSKNELQKKYIANWKLSEQEINELNNVLEFFTEVYDNKCDVEYIVDAYLFLNNAILEETYYFMVNGNYRNSTFKEVNDSVYANKEYMGRYMIGLSVSDYIWINHLKMIRYFEENIKLFSGDKYLEIGPGFGQYLSRAIANCNFNEYSACDVSETSVNGSNKYLEYKELGDKCKVTQKDFFDYASTDKFDCIVMGEVLEHVEKPLDMLLKLYELLSENGKAFITTAINAPTPDHIYLFRNVEEVLSIVKEAGFNVIDYAYYTAGDISFEKAVKKKQAISIALILGK